MENKRLTKKKPGLDMYVFDRDVEYANFEDGLALLQIIGRLEDLEEEIGCPLEVVFKALKNGFYDEYGNLYKVGEFCLDYNWLLSNASDKYLTFNVEDTYFEFKLADYKKTWWLKENREE